MSLSFPSGADSAGRTSGGVEYFFGRDVLRGLVTGLQQASARPRTERRWGPGVLGCAMWMDDPELIATLGTMANLCIVVTKQTERNLAKSKARAVHELAQSTGLAQRYFPELREYAPKDGGKPLMVGPGSPDWTDEALINGVREVGFRTSNGGLVPIVHSKILLLGQMRWFDEHPSDLPLDYEWFEPERLWIGSANFTQSSRRGLEMGLWTPDADLMDAAREFLLQLVTLSEPLGQGPDELDPELVPVEYDDDAIAEYFREIEPGEPWDDDEDVD